MAIAVDFGSPGEANGRYLAHCDSQNARLNSRE
jgi:hypothetical protein